MTGRNSLRIFIMLLLLTGYRLYGVSGLSSTKLILPSANVLSPERYEFDISFYWLRTSSYFDRNGGEFNIQECGEIVCKKNTIQERNFTFRFTSGIGFNTEIGLETGYGNEKYEFQDFVSPYFDDIKLGMKNLLFDGNIKLAAQWGLSYDVEKYVPLYEAGLIFTKDWENLSFDIDFHYFTTPRILIFEEEYNEQVSWYHGPHLGLGFSYTLPAFPRLQLSLEYHHEQGFTKTRRYKVFTKSDIEKNRNLIKLLEAETGEEWRNPHIDEIFELPEMVMEFDIIDEHFHTLNVRSNYVVMSDTLYYGVIYNLSDSASLTLILGELFAGRNVNREKLANIIVTYAF